MENVKQLSYLLATQLTITTMMFIKENNADLTRLASGEERWVALFDDAVNQFTELIAKATIMTSEQSENFRKGIYNDVSGI